MISNVHQIVCMYSVHNMSMIFKETSFALCNLSTLMRRRSGTFSLHDLTDQDFLPEGSNFLFHEGSNWFNTSYEDTQPFGEDSILTALLSINGYLFFLHLNTGTMGKSNKGTVQVWCDWMCTCGTLR